jgi:putative transposase
MMYVRFPLSLRNVEDLLHERGIDVSHETIRFWWNRFGPMFATEIRKRRVQQLRSYSNWQWHLDEVFVKINGEIHYLWRAVDHEGEVLESYVTKRRNRKAALKFPRKSMKRHGRSEVFVTGQLRSYGAAMKDIGNADRQETGRAMRTRGLMAEWLLQVNGRHIGNGPPVFLVRMLALPFCTSLNLRARVVGALE